MLPDFEVWIVELQNVGIIDLNKKIGENSIPSDIATAVRWSSSE